LTPVALLPVTAAGQIGHGPGDSKGNKLA
jgi:hypothetical protein